MKTIYKSLMTIAFAGLCLASCDKELKEETAMEVGVVTDNNVSFNGNTVTVKKGSPVTFSICRIEHSHHLVLIRQNKTLRVGHFHC